MLKINRVLYLLVFVSVAALAGPDDHVASPIVEYDGKTVNFNVGSGTDFNRGFTTQVTSAGLDYAVTKYWDTGLVVKKEKIDGEPQLNVLEWENKFQFTETGKYPLEVGMISIFVFPMNQPGTPNKIKFGPLFQTELDKLQLNVVLLFQRNFAGEKAPTDEPYSTISQYRWQAKYKWKDDLAFGMQGFGEMGEWNNWKPSHQQEHKMGPAVFGKVAVSEHQTLILNAVWLIGITEATPNNTFRLQVEYEF